MIIGCFVGGMGEGREGGADEGGRYVCSIFVVK